jgi:protein involved in polysaccharide export with SLBB domain
MTKRLFVSLVLLLIASSPVLHAQSSAGNGSYDAQQGSSALCADGSASVNGVCGQDQQQSQGDVSPTGSLRSGETGAASPSENATLGGRNAVRQAGQELPADLPTEFQKFVAATTGQLLPIYGVSLFRNVPSTFSPSDLTPATSAYVIGPDDELRVRMWGQVDYSGNLRVDRSGNIYLPQVGEVHVAGLPFSALDQHMRAAVARIYRNFDLSVDLGRIRSIQIYVTGQARRPGAYTVSSLSSLVDALFASGGPSPQGSLRHIQLNRAGKTIADFDLYALLIHGDKSKDIALLPEDVLFIPVAGPQVAITGSVRNPGIYELRGDETIGELLDAAGKTTALSSSARISLERVEERQLRQAMDIAFDASGLATPLADGDILRINSILPAYQNTVTLRGNVANPGRFALRPGMHLSDLIPDRDSLVSRDYWWKRSHLGLPVPEFEPAITTLGQDPLTPEVSRRGFTSNVTQATLTAALTANNQQDLNASRQDVNAVSQGNTGAQQGANGQNQGFAGSNQSSNSSSQSGNVLGQNSAGSSQSTANAGQTAGSGSLAAQLSQSPGPGGQVLPKRNEVRLSAPDINWSYAVIERLDPDTLKTSLIPFDLGKLVLNHDASQDLALQPGDAITIFSQADIRVPLEQQTKYVNLEGEFVHSGIYSVQPGETLRDLVQRAGGITGKAYLYGSEFTRESTRVMQQQRLDEYVKTVAMAAAQGTQQLTASASQAGEAEASRIDAQQLTARLSQIRATGRIVLQFHPKSTSVDDVPAITLENGDRFVVPFAPATINVVGAVYNQNSFLYQPSRSVGSYLQLAGGPNRNADANRAFVIHADGAVISRESVKSVWGNEFKKLRLNPGDTIVVPDKTLRPSTLRNIMDWSQVFSQLAIGAAVVTVL